MDQYLARCDVLMNVSQCRIDYFWRDEVDVVHIHQIEDQATWPPGHEILWVIFRRSAPGVTQRLPVIGLLAGMNDKPAALAANGSFIVLRTDKQVI